MKILLIDDSVDMGFLVKVSLKPYQVNHVFSVQEAQEVMARENFDLLLIDVTLPDGDGFRVCSEYSKDPRWAQVPKILLTAKGDAEDKVFGFNCGADDYITKPFVHSELRARVDVRLRARNSPTASNFQWEDFEFDGHFQKCWLHTEDGREDLLLTPTEYRLLLSLARNQGLPLTREEIVEAVWKAHGANIESRGVDAHIVHLRRKLGSQNARIVSVYGKGYALEASPPGLKGQAA